ncbi:MAG: hypothetical protein ACFE9R_02325 [Candidatus Hermodarchaeota archaeon]
MEIKLVYKWLGIFGVAFCLITMVELIFNLLFSMTITMNLNGDILPVGGLIFASGFMPIHAMLIEVILLCVILIFMALGAILFFISRKKKFQELNLAKYILMIGLFLIIGGFFKLTFLTFLEKTGITTGTISIQFQDAIYTPSITPLFGAIIWMYFIGIACTFLISGVIFGAVGLKWILNLQETK